MYSRKHVLRQGRSHHRRGRRHRPRRRAALPRPGRVGRPQRHARCPVLEAAQAELDPSGERTLIVAGQITGRDAGARARRARRRALRRRRRARQQHRHLPPGAVRGADRGALRGGARLDPAADLLGLAGRRAVDARARRRRDRQRRLDVGGRRDRHHADQRLLGGAGRPARADQEPRDRAGGGRHPGQHRRAGVRRDARLRAVHDAGGGAGRARLGRRLPPARAAWAAGRRGRGRGVPRRRWRAVDHRDDAADRRRGAGRAVARVRRGGPRPRSERQPRLGREAVDRPLARRLSPLFPQREQSDHAGVA